MRYKLLQQRKLNCLLTPNYGRRSQLAAGMILESLGMDNVTAVYEIM